MENFEHPIVVIRVGLVGNLNVIYSHIPAFEMAQLPLVLLVNYYGPINRGIVPLWPFLFSM